MSITSAQSATTSGRSSFNVVSTFAGCGGSSLGYQWAGGKVLCAIEWDDNAVATYRANFTTTPVLHRDIAKVSVAEVLELTGLAPGELDILDGSPPCQGFSTSGKRVLDDPRNSLFREYVRLLEGLRPRVFVMENVSGMVKGKMKLVFAEVMRALKGAGYCVSARKLNAMYFGVPQSRQRMIFVGVRDDLGVEPSHPKAQARPLACHTVLDPDDVRVSRYSQRRYGDVIVTVTKPVPTITRLTRLFLSSRQEFGLRNYARCGSYPDAYVFVGTFGDARDRIGNSVPPRFMQAIAEHVRDEILDQVATRESDGAEFSPP